MERGMQLTDVFIGAGVAAVATGASQTGSAPEWVSIAVAAVTGSAVGAGFRFLAGQFDNWGRGIAAFAVGIVGAYYGAALTIGFFGLDPSIQGSLTFFMGTFVAGVIKALATSVSASSVIDRYLDKKLGKRSGGDPT